MIGTNDPNKEHFMTIASLGALHIEVTPTTDPGIMSVDIGAQHRRETISMQTNKDETVDQFCVRLRSMLRALINGEPRVLKEEKIPELKKRDKSWEEQKAELKSEGAKNATV